MDYSNLKPMRYLDVLKEAYRRGFRVINSRDLRDRIEELEDDDEYTDNSEPSYILIGNLIIDLEEAWDTDAYIDDLDY